MSRQTILGNYPNLYDADTGRWVGYIDTKGQQQFVGIAQPTASRVTSGDFSLASVDDNSILYPDGACVITVQAGLSPMPNVGFVAPPTGSITIRTSGATVNGDVVDIVRNRATDPAGFALVPLGVPDTYSLTGGLTGFASLSGNATDNASLVAQFAQISNIPLYVNTGIKNLFTGNHQFNAGDSGTTWANKSNNAYVGNVPAGLSLTFSVNIRLDNAAGGTVAINPLSGVQILSRGGALRLTTNHTGAVLWCSGVQDQFYLDSPDLVV